MTSGADDRKGRLLDYAGNVVFILATVLLCAYILTHWKRNDSGAQAAPAPVAVGDRMPSLSGIDYRGAPNTLLLVVNSGCHFCTNSMPFYKRLADRVEQANTRLVVASLEPPDVTREYFLRNGMTVEAAVQLDPARLPVSATPTLMAIERSGIVARTWVGMLSAEQEQAVLAQVQ